MKSLSSPAVPTEQRAPKTLLQFVNYSFILFESSLSSSEDIRQLHSDCVRIQKRSSRSASQVQYHVINNILHSRPLAPLETYSQGFLGSPQKKLFGCQPSISNIKAPDSTQAIDIFHDASSYETNQRSECHVN